MDLNITNETLTRRKRTRGVKNENTLRLRSATKDPVQLRGAILLQLQIGYLNTCVWFRILFRLAVSLLLKSSLINRLTRDVFSNARNGVPWNSQSVAILASMQKEDSNANASLITDDPSNFINNSIADLVRPAQQVVILPNITKAKTVTIIAPDLVIVEPYHVPSEGRLTLATRGIVETLPNRTFYNIISKFLRHRAHLPEHVNIAYKDPPSSAIHECRANTQKLSTTETPEGQRKSQTNLQGCNSLDNNNSFYTVALVHYKHDKNCTTRMVHPTNVFVEDSERLTHDLRDPINLPNNCGE